MKLGYIGLGKMGKNMVLHLLEQGVEIVAWNRSPEPIAAVVKAGAVGAESIGDLVSSLRGTKQSQENKITTSKTPRNDNVVVWLMLPAGEIVDEFIKKLIPVLDKGDLIVDGGNSFYKDSLRRAELLSKQQIHFMDIGVSGGPAGARSGACLMVGGSKEDYQMIAEIVEKASAPKAFGHFGSVGAGHFAKMVHNGIEYGMMEAIGEGAAVLRYAPFELNLPEIFRVYNNRSVIESRLIGWTQKSLAEDPELSEISSVINATGEGEWTVNAAKELGVSVPVIEDSFKARQTSKEDDENSPNGFRNKVVSAMRGKFGQHEVKK